MELSDRFLKISTPTLPPRKNVRSYNNCEQSLICVHIACVCVRKLVCVRSCVRGYVNGNKRTHGLLLRSCLFVRAYTCIYGYKRAHIMRIACACVYESIRACILHARILDISKTTHLFALFNGINDFPPPTVSRRDTTDTQELVFYPNSSMGWP